MTTPSKPRKNVSPKTIAIFGVGSYLPDEVRTNAWWPEHIVESWQAQRRKKEEVTNLRQGAPSSFEGADLIMEAMAELGDDIFAGAKERRIMPEAMRSSDMEVIAARRAIEDAGIPTGDIDLLIGYETVTDYPTVPNACKIHHALGLNERCMTFNVDTGCNALHSQLAIARALIQSGQCRRALLVQGNSLRRLVPIDALHSPWFGDGATAMVVGPAKEGFGLLAESHFADGSLFGGMVCSVPGKRWFDPGEVTWHALSRRAGKEMLMRIPSMAKQAIGAVLEESSLPATDVGVFAAHQGTAWFGSVSQKAAGLKNAYRHDNFPWTASLSSCNIPLQIEVAKKEGRLQEGTWLVTFSGGSGITWSAAAIRWGGA